MGNKAPKMRERYRLRVPNGGLIEVTRDVYLAYYQAKRRERYQTELCYKHKVTTAPEVLLKSVWDIEEIVAKKIVNEALYTAIGELDQESAYIIQKVYFDNSSLSAVSKELGWGRKKTELCCRKTLKTLKEKLAAKGVDSSCLM